MSIKRTGYQIYIYANTEKPREELLYSQLFEYLDINRVIMELNKHSLNLEQLTELDALIRLE